MYFHFIKENIEMFFYLVITITEYFAVQRLSGDLCVGPNLLIPSLTENFTRIGMICLFIFHF